MERPRLPLDQVLAVMGLSARFAGDDPLRPTHLRLAISDRAVLWPLRSPRRALLDETLLAVADMVANASQLERANRSLVAWSRLHRLEPSERRTQAAFHLALVLDDLAERLLSRPVLHGLLESTTWRTHLHPDSEPGQTTGAGDLSWTNL